MKTDALIDLLASGPVAADAHAPERRLGGATALGALLAATAMLAALGVRPDLADAARDAMFWVKLAMPVAVGAAAFVAAARWGRPGDRAPGPLCSLGAIGAALAVAAIATLASAAPAARPALLQGSTALGCTASIVALSLPAFALALRALRGLAPTRPRAAGAAAGLLAGAVAAAVYALHCDEMALPFLAVWYVLGMAVPAAVGGLIGPLVLRWK